MSKAEILHHLNCTADASTDVHVFFNIDRIPVFNNILWDTPEQALKAKRGDMSLAFCATCGHIYNTRFQPELVEYDVAYENSLHFSPHFQQFITDLSADLIERYDLHGKNIIDIGCGKGDFLKLICQMGSNTGFGFDKSYEPTPEDQQLEHVHFIQDFFTEAYSDYQADMIVCRHVLEHIQYPAEFLRGIRDTVGDRLDTVIFFEVPNGLYTLRDMGIWDIIYEHCSYFTPHSLINLFVQNGFDVHRVQEVYGGQFLTLEATPSISAMGSSVEAEQSLENLATLVQVFSDKYTQKSHFWRTNIEQFRVGKEKVVIWGTGSKGVTFLNVMHSEDVIDYAVDINPRKQGRYVAGSGQKIVAPEFLSEYQPDVVIVMNPLYMDEICSTLDQLGVTARYYSM